MTPPATLFQDPHPKIWGSRPQLSSGLTPMWTRLSRCGLALAQMRCKAIAICIWLKQHSHWVFLALALLCGLRLSECSCGQRIICVSDDINPRRRQWHQRIASYPSATSLLLLRIGEWVPRDPKIRSDGGGRWEGERGDRGDRGESDDMVS